MYTKYEIKDGKILVFDKFGYYKTMKLSSNIKEILICENNIEEMKKLIEEKELNITNSKKKIKSKSLTYFPQAALWGTNSILQFVLSNNIFPGTLFGINFVLHSGLGIASILPETKHIKINKAKLDLIKKYLSKEEIKLKELNEANNQDLNYIPQSDTIPTTSEQISILKTHLNILHDYISDKRHYIKHYKDGSLRNMVKVIAYYSEEQIKFLEELIKQDLKDYNTDKDIIYYKH